MNTTNPKIKSPACEAGIGRIILAPDSPDLIAGVKIEPFRLWPDDRGYFLEVARLRQGLAADFPPKTTQVSAALSYPGAIKAFHYHLKQTDLWVPVQGMLQVAMVDLRPESPTYGAKNTLYAGVLRPWQILIPPGVAHGYKVIGTAAAMLVYLTSRLYDPKDEGRIKHDEPGIGYDWEPQYK
ncbi:MAG: dTDP-4-dehydrorhamnose 3,5-epimerase family protein [Candidatus Solibacter usitatus]|nr:dTDP-4-dehydrorhamnose 3,5-epimerase family protein [Candidatus Solibacter usitatus]